MLQHALESVSAVEIAAPLVVGIVVLARLYYAPVVFAPRFTRLWNILRRIGVPLLQQGIYRFLPITVSIENKAVEEELVGVADATPTGIATAVDSERNVEIPLLAGYKTDWEDNAESGTFVWYCGSKPAGWPRWLRHNQVHVTMFETDNGTRITAHKEANPWRLDLAVDHLTKGPSFDAHEGVVRTRRALSDAGIDLRMETQQ
jgi:hypothetical protein